MKPPYLNLDLDTRLDKFEDELTELENGPYFHFFESRPDPLGKTDYDRIIYHYTIHKSGLFPNKKVVLKFNDDTDLPIPIKEICLKVFLKHFPDGIQGFLMGYSFPQK